MDQRPGKEEVQMEKKKKKKKILDQNRTVNVVWFVRTDASFWADRSCPHTGTDVCMEVNTCAKDNSGSACRSNFI